MTQHKNREKSASWGLKRTAVLAVSLLLLPLGASAAEGDETDVDEGGPGMEFPYRYAAQFVCGKAEKGSGGQLVFGKYATQINMENWHGKGVKLRKKVALTYPPRMEQQGKASEWIGPEKIKPSHALSVDCEEIIGSGKFDSEFFDELPLLGNGEEPGFYTGYLVIQSNRSLNVTTVHTAGPRPNKEGDEDDDDKEGKSKQPQVHSIAVTNVPEHIRGQFQQNEEAAE
ncbi:MAG: hypothetical protein PVG22_03940 [Chromatiales bacterium]|jgi:hypothetical protein